MSNVLKILIATLCIIILGGAAYFILSAKSAEDELADVTSTANESNEVDVSMRTEKILADTQKIDRYSLKGESIFDDTRFTTLKYFRREIEDVNTGRENPFQPIN